MHRERAVGVGRSDGILMNSDAGPVVHTNQKSTYAGHIQPLRVMVFV